MNETEIFPRGQLVGTGSQAPSRAEPDVSYVELNVTALAAPRVRRDENGLTSTYSELKFPKDEPLVNEDAAAPIASGPRELPNNARAGPHKQESKENVGNRPDRKICVLCLVASALIAIVVGLSIYVSQIRHSQIRTDQNYEILCQFLNNNRGEATTDSYLPRDHKDWMKNEDRCYFISTVETSYNGATNNCSIIHARLLEINSKEEENVISNALVHQDRPYWIGKCENKKAASSLMYMHDTGTSVCGTCHSSGWSNHCNSQHRFICEKRAHWRTDIPEKNQDLCQQSVGPT